jgi:phosphohistidine phosphatase SixA
MKQYCWGRGASCSMLTILLSVQLLVVQGAAIKAADLPATIVLVRHADKETKPGTPEDAPLKQEGFKRAQDLKAVLAGANLTAIITTQWKRTKDTAQPTADKFGLAPEQVRLEPDPDQEDAHLSALVAKLQTKAGGTVLVVGHDSTVPELINRLLSGSNLSAICSSVYDRLFVLVLASSKPVLVQSRYGALTPEINCN